MRLTSACVLASALLLSGCGSTVAMTRQTTLAGTQDASGLGAPAPVPAPAGSVPASIGGDGAAISGSRGPSAGTTGAVAAGTTGAAVPSQAAGGARLTTPVKIGYFVLKDTGAAFAALGYSGLSSGNGTTQVKTAVALANAHGGIGGRKIVPVIFEADATQSAAQQYATACATFFQDNKVEALVSINYSDALSQCAQNHGVPMISDSTASTSDASTTKNPLLVVPNQLSVERAASTLVKGLVSTGWLAPAKKPVIGLITFSDPGYAKVQSIVRSALSRAGLSLKDTYFMPSDDPSAGAPAGRSAALKFQSEGIDHVIGIDTGFGMSWFTLSAGQQSYYPKLGMTSLSLPGAFPLLFTDQQLAGSQVIGWSPALDTIPAQQPLVGTRTADCVKAMTQAGEDMSADLARLQAELLCDATWFLADTFTQGTVSAVAMRAGLAALTHGFQSTVAFRSDPRADRIAASAYRQATYATSRKCYLYSGPLRPVG